jgi:PAS domain S-box-containing protein
MQSMTVRHPDRPDLGSPADDATHVGSAAPVASARPHRGPGLLLVGAERASEIGGYFEIGGAGLVLGRGSEAAVRLHDPGLSRRHAQVRLEPGEGYVLTDLGSTNGTYLNGARVSRAVLAEGDRIRMGLVTLLRFGRSEAAPAPEVRLWQALTASASGIWEWNVESDRLTFVGGIARRLPTAADSTADGPDADWALVHPGDRDAMRAALRAAVAGSGSCEMDCRLRLPSGTAWVAMRGEVFRDAEGRALHVAGTLMDVTERREAEVELRRHSLIFGSLGEGVAVLGARGDVLDWNRQAERTFGWSRAEALGRRLGRLLSGDPDAVTRALLEGVDREGRFAGEFRLRRKDGGECLVELSAVPMTDAAGKRVALVVVLRDVGERRRLEVRLQFAERLASLGTMAAGMGHEINNPLAFVTSNLQHLRTLLGSSARPSGSPEGVDPLLDDCEEGLRRIGAIVRGLRASASAADLPAGASLARAIDFAVRLAKNRAEERARLVQDVGPVPRTAGSDVRIGQVLVNLVLNAVDAIPPGHPERNEVRVAARHDEGSGRVVVEVSDTGSGIAPEHLPRIFDPFFTTRSTRGGTGLGLFVCHEIVSECGGEIEVESEPGRGTTFRVLLPVLGAAPAPGPGTC